MEQIFKSYQRENGSSSTSIYDTKTTVTAHLGLKRKHSNTEAKPLIMMKPSSSSTSSPSSIGSRSFTLSSVSVAVDKATSELLLTPDWTIIIAICDSLNSHHWQCKDAIKAVKRRLQHKSSKVQLLTLTLLEAMLKNCGDFVHSHIAEKHVLEDMVKIVKKKGDFGVRNRILILLDTWNEAFSGVSRRYPHYSWAYQELTRSGVKFPKHSKEAPLMLEAPPAQPNVTQSSSSSSMNLMSIGSFRRLDETMATEIESLSLSSLESMRNVMDLVNDMLQAINPSDKSALKDELIVDLVEQCRSNQKKLIQMLTTTGDEDVMARGLELNDSLQVVLARHDAIASGVYLPMLEAPEPIELKTSDDVADALESESSSSSSSSESETEEGEEVKDDFMQLAKRHVLLNTEHSDEEEDTLLLGNNNEKKPAETETTTQCKDLALLDTTTTTTSKSEQDIIELLSLTLSTTALPSPQPHPQPQTQTQTQSQSYFADDHILMNSYVVPWAQQSHAAAAAEPQVSKMAQFAQPEPQFNPWAPQPQQPQFSYGYPHQPQWNGGGQVNGNDRTFWSHQGGNSENKVFERNLQYSNSFPARAAGSSTASAAAVEGQPQRQYVPPYRLFEDLNVFWNADGGVRR